MGLTGWLLAGPFIVGFYLIVGLAVAVLFVASVAVAVVQDVARTVQRRGNRNGVS